jgi:hypothetical protein
MMSIVIMMVSWGSETSPTHGGDDDESDIYIYK